MCKIIQFPEGENTIFDFGGSSQLIRDADLVINGAGVVLKDRDGVCPRQATEAELAEATQVE